MSDVVKRPRGRPKGSGKDDSMMLAAIADMVLAKSIRPTSAMKQLVRQNIKSEDRPNKEHQVAADVRRLQVKWAEASEELLAAARERAEAHKEAQRRARTSRGTSGGYSSGGIGCLATEIARRQSELEALTRTDGGIGRFAAEIARRQSEFEVFTRAQGSIGSVAVEMARRQSEFEALTGGRIGSVAAELARQRSEFETLTGIRSGLGNTVAELYSNSGLTAATATARGLLSAEEQHNKALGYPYNPRTGMPW